VRTQKRTERGTCDSVFRREGPHAPTGHIGFFETVVAPTFRSVHEIPEQDPEERRAATTGTPVSGLNSAAYRDAAPHLAWSAGCNS
jgi:hypothetical protein